MDRETPDLHYTDPALAAIYDLESGWSIDRDFFLGLAGPDPQRILDLGCGTGLLCLAYAEQGHSVTGVDPASAMLDVAQAKPGADKVTWVQSTAQAFQSAGQFDLIIMTGHAFQVLLTDDAIQATFAAMRRHLAPGGQIVFESRNPAVDWAAMWNTDQDFLQDGKIIQQSRRIVTAQDNQLTFDTEYKLGGTVRTSRSTLLFLTHVQIADKLAAAGLRVRHLLGDWSAAPCDPEQSQDMIFVVEVSSPIVTMP